MRKCNVRFLVFVCAAVVSAGGGPGVLGSTLVYENWDANAIGGYYAPTMEFLRIADDMNLAGTERILDHYDFAIYVTAGTAPYTVTSELYTDDPITGTPNTPIPGTSCVHMVNADGYVVLDCAPGTGAILPDRLWMVLTLLTEPSLGWMIAEAAETGYTDDVFAMEDPILGWELYWFGGPPDPYSGFEANIWCRKPPVPHLKWSQPPVEIDPNSSVPRYCGWDEPAFTKDPCSLWKLVVDDFRCLGTMPVTSVHWWGSHYGWEDFEPPLAEEPNAWRIGFWSNIPAGVDTTFSHPNELLWQTEVAADRVCWERAGVDQHPMFPQDACFQYYVQLEPEEYFWQADFDTQDDVFWLSIAAVYDPCDEPAYPWGWKTRPWSWMDDAVWFEVYEDPQPGMVVESRLMTPMVDPLLDKSADVAFELDTDANWIKWEQPFTGIRNWPHYEDEVSMGKVEPAKWSQMPDPIGWDVAFDTGVGDDWLCTESGSVSDIHFWCSWKGDIVGQMSRVEVWIWSDDPCDYPGDYSKPNLQLWYRQFFPADFTVSWAGQGDQGWFGPFHHGPDSEVRRPDHNDYYRIDIEDINDPFVQQQGTIYWLVIRMHTTEGEAGWKTSLDHWNDDAIFWCGGTHWHALHDPCTGEPLDFAFEIATETNEVNIVSLVADDWKCERVTPVTATVWWGSYIGYRYQACSPEAMNLPVAPDYFGLTIWTDIPDPNPGDPATFSHPNEVIWEYKAYEYDEVMVGYDKHPEGPAFGHEAVFRYSAKLPREAWFFQEDVNNIYWFSVVAVYETNSPNYDWGWTNHEHEFNDDAVSGHWEVNPFGGPPTWVWQELYDQTSQSEDMSFILFTDPEAETNCRMPTECAGHSRGDSTCDGSINLADLFALKAYFGSSAPWTDPECCSDYNNDGSVNLGDLFVLKAGFGTSGYVPSTLNQSCAGL